MAHASERPPSAAAFAEARSQFPVLERIAYLNAGTFGPLSRSTVEAVARELARELRGRAQRDCRASSAPWPCGSQPGRRSASLVGVEPEHVTLTAQHDRRLQHRRRPGSISRPGDEVVTTTDEHFGLLGPLHASGATVVVEPDARCDRRGGDAANAPARPLAGALDDRHACFPSRALRPETGVPVLVDGAQSVGAIPVSAAGRGLSHHLRAEVALRARLDRRPRRRRPRALRVASPSYFSQVELRSRTARSRPVRVPHDSIPTGGRRRTLAGLLAALEHVPSGRSATRATVAERCRALLADRSRS